MFDLEAKIQEWRQEMAATLGEHGDVVDELESHLREELYRAALVGQPAEEAWRAAVSRLGSPTALAAEFAKVPAARPLHWAPAWICVGAYVLVMAGIAFPLLARARGNDWSDLLLPHVLTILAGYLATLAFGGLSAWLTLHRLWGGATHRRVECLRWWGWRFALTGFVLCAAGFVLGGLWTLSAWGSFWNSDAREFGGLAMIAWNGFALACLARSRAPWRVDLAIGLVGSFIVGWAWFVASLTGLHSYPPALYQWSIFLAIYFAGHALLLIVALLPPRRGHRSLLEASL